MTTNPPKTLREFAIEFLHKAKGNPEKAEAEMFKHFTQDIALYRRFADVFMQRAVHDICQEVMRSERSVLRGTKLRSGEADDSLRIVDSEGNVLNRWVQWLGICDKMLYDATYSDLQREIDYYRTLIRGNALPMYTFVTIQSKLKRDNSDMVSDAWDTEDTKIYEQIVLKAKTRAEKI